MTTLTKLFVALGTFVGLLASVDEFVPLGISLPLEAFVTITTFEWLFS